MGWIISVRVQVFQFFQDILNGIDPFKRGISAFSVGIQAVFEIFCDDREAVSSFGYRHQCAQGRAYNAEKNDQNRQGRIKAEGIYSQDKQRYHQHIDQDITDTLVCRCDDILKTEQGTIVVIFRDLKNNFGNNSLKSQILSRLM